MCMCVVCVYVVCLCVCVCCVCACCAGPSFSLEVYLFFRFKLSFLCLVCTLVVFLLCLQMKIASKQSRARTAENNNNNEQKQKGTTQTERQADRGTDRQAGRQISVWFFTPQGGLALTSSCWMRMRIMSADMDGCWEVLRSCSMLASSPVEMAFELASPASIGCCGCGLLLWSWRSSLVCAAADGSLVRAWATRSHASSTAFSRARVPAMHRSHKQQQKEEEEEDGERRACVTDSCDRMHGHAYASQVHRQGD